VATIKALVVDDEPLGRERVRALLEREKDVEVVGECEDGVEAVEAIRVLTPDLVFLDVQMPEMDGFGVVEAVGPHRMPLVVFVTAYDQYALSAFEVNAVDYLLKPFDLDRFHTALERVRTRLQHPAGAKWAENLEAMLERVRRPTVDYPDRFLVRSGRRYVFVRVDEIDWIGAADNYLELHLDKRVHLLRETMSAMEGRLDPRRFMRIHRSAIVNVDRIRAIESWGKGEYLVIMNDGTQVNSSRAYRDRIASLMRGV
jgi:two-component system, LytTR family, response regulator